MAGKGPFGRQPGLQNLDSIRIFLLHFYSISFPCEIPIEENCLKLNVFVCVYLLFAARSEKGFFTLEGKITFFLSIFSLEKHT